MPKARPALISVMNLLSATGIGKKEEGQWVLKDVSFTLRTLQKLALAGATGSGKTTLLKIIAGLIAPTTGAVYFKGERIKGPNEKLLPGHPSIAYLSQHFELRNHYRVQEVLDMEKKVDNDEAWLVYDVCRIAHLLNRWTHQLSGGERQRIALARLLVGAPALLLLDEPYSNLDAFHKNVLKAVVDDVSNGLKITCLLVSHDPRDTLSWADAIIVLNKGRVVQYDSPKQVYQNPTNAYIASLFGKYNMLTPALAKALSDYAHVEMQDLERFIRPEEFVLVEKEKGVKATVQEVLFMGGYAEAHLCTAGATLVVHTLNGNLCKGDEVYVALQRE